MDTPGKLQGEEGNFFGIPHDEVILPRVLDSLECIVFIADIDTNKILFSNRYLKNLFGFDPIGRNCKHLLYSTQDDDTTFIEGAGLLGEDGKPLGVVSREYQNPFNKKWYSAKSQAIEWTEGTFVRLEVAMDITEQRQLLTFLNEARNQADIAITTKNRFVAMVAHDLKSPLYRSSACSSVFLKRKRLSMKSTGRLLRILSKTVNGC